MADDKEPKYTVMTSAATTLIGQLADNSNSIKSFRAVASDTNHWADDLTALEALTDLDSVKQTGTYMGEYDQGTTVETIQIDFNQSDITDTYQLATIGLYATDANDKEILYAIECLQEAQPMTPSTTKDVSTHYIQIAVGNTANVTVEVSDAGMVTQAEFNKALANYTSTADMPALIANNLPANILTKDNLTTQVADLAQTDKANIFSQPQTFSKGALAPNGKAYITADDVNPTDLSAYHTHDQDTAEFETQADAQTAHEMLSAPNLIDVATDDWQTVPTGIWNVQFPYQVIAGHTYFFGADLQSSATSPTNIFAWSDVKNQTILSGFKQPTPVAKSSTGTVGTIFTAPTTMTIYVVVGALNSNDPWKYRHVVFTETDFEMTYAQAQASRHGSDGIDKEQDIVGTRNYIKNSATPISIDGDTDHYKTIFGSLITNKTYTFESDITITKGDSLQQVGISVFDSNNSSTFKSIGVYPKVVNGHIVATFTVPNGGTNLLVYAGEGNYNTTPGHAITLTNYHLNAGVAKTDWSPAPEDKVTDNHDGSITVNGTNYIMANFQGRNPSTGTATNSLNYDGTNKLTVGGLPGLGVQVVSDNSETTAQKQSAANSLGLYATTE